MNTETERSIDMALRHAAADISQESRDRLDCYVDSEARDALLAALDTLGPVVMRDLALETLVERLRTALAQTGYHGSLTNSPLHPHHRTARQARR